MITPNMLDNHAFALAEMVCAFSHDLRAQPIACVSACYVSFPLYFVLFFHCMLVFVVVDVF